jgi:hypothetical protein
MAKLAGVSYTDLIESVIASARERVTR